MPSLGVGKSTPYSQTSNYHTVLNHKFREESPYEPAKQVKVKCPYCGIWARKGFDCSLCGTHIPGQPPQLMTSTRARARSRSPTVGTPTAGARSVMRAKTPTRAGTSVSSGVDFSAVSPRSGARQHYTAPTGSNVAYQLPTTPTSAKNHAVPRDSGDTMTPKRTRPSHQTNHNPNVELQVKKVKCSYCGIWVQLGKYCSLCRTLA